MYRILVFLIFFSNLSLANSDFEEALDEMQRISSTSLGVSVPALGYLLNMRETSAIAETHFVMRDVMPMIEELENAGFIKTARVQGLVDGSQSEQMFITIEILRQGLLIKAHFAR